MWPESLLASRPVFTSPGSFPRCRFLGSWGLSLARKSATCRRVSHLCFLIWLFYPTCGLTTQFEPKLQVACDDFVLETTFSGPVLGRQFQTHLSGILRLPGR
jgi:hypothetical protein